MADFRSMMAHGKADTKMDKKNDRVRDNLLQRFSIDPLFQGLIREMAEMKNCSKVLYFEGRKKKDLFLTVADVEEGPTIRFNVEGLNTMGELKFSGNCLKVIKSNLL